MTRIKAWLQKAFGSRRRLVASPAVYRPRLEALEDRRLLNANQVFDALGQPVLFVAYADGTAVRYDSGGATILYNGSLMQSGQQTQAVESIHGFRDPFGNVGFDVVFSSVLSNGVFVHHDWQVVDAAGAHDQGTGLYGIHSASTVYDPAGNRVLDIVQSNGEWDHYTNAGGAVFGPGVPGQSVYNSASTSFDNLGRPIYDVVFDTVLVNGQVKHDQWYRYDASGGPLFQGDNITAVSQTFDNSGLLVLQITYTNGSVYTYDASGRVTNVANGAS
jgi:hypothetical protein